MNILELLYDYISWVNDSYEYNSLIMYSNRTVTNNQYELLRIYVNNFIENNIDNLIKLHSHDRMHYLHHYIVENNRFRLNNVELQYITNYIVSLDNSLCNDITNDYKNKYPLGLYRFK